MNELEPKESGGEFLLYQTEDGQVKLEVRLQNETVWLTQQMIAELLQTTIPNISMHIRNIYAEGELTPEATIKKFLTVRQEGTRAVRRELDYYRPNMGLTSWKGDEVRKTDVAIAKNYLKEEEIDELNRIVVMWLDFAEDQAKRRKQVFMKDWEQKLDEFLRFNDRSVLPNAGKVTKKSAEGYAKAKYEKFDVRCREYKESLAEAEYVAQLEKAAKLLPVKKTKGKKNA